MQNDYKEMKNNFTKRKQTQKQIQRDDRLQRETKNNYKDTTTTTIHKKQVQRNSKTTKRRCRHSTTCQQIHYKETKTTTKRLKMTSKGCKMNTKTQNSYKEIQKQLQRDAKLPLKNPKQHLYY